VVVAAVVVDVDESTNHHIGIEPLTYGDGLKYYETHKCILILPNGSS